MEREATVAKIALLAGLEPRKRIDVRFLAAYWTLTKPDVNLLIAIAVLASFCQARPADSARFPVCSADAYLARYIADRQWYRSA